jgi:hypothetical protein
VKAEKCVGYGSLTVYDAATKRVKQRERLAQTYRKPARVFRKKFLGEESLRGILGRNP